MNDRTTMPAGARVPAYTSEIPDAPGYYVYRLWADDACLYVGRVGDSGPRPPRARLNFHRRSREWWSEVTRIEVAELPDHPAMVAEELKQIEHLRPRYNVLRSNCTHDLSLPGAVKPTGACRACAREYTREYGRRTAQKISPERRAKRRQYDRAHQPLHNAAKRRRRRAAGPGQGSLW